MVTAALIGGLTIYHRSFYRQSGEILSQQIRSFLLFHGMTGLILVEIELCGI
jgi:hypothetical protein